MSRPSGTAQPLVVFVVLNWNQRELTLECLASLSVQRYRSVDIILVDNGSTDGSVPAVRQAYPAVTVIENGANLGFAAANNAGIRLALQRGAAYVFLLNNDTLVAPDMLSRLVEVGSADAAIGVLGPAVLYYDQPGIVSCAGNGVDWRDASTRLIADGEPYTDVAALAPYPVAFVSGCAICVKRAVIEAIGLLDERCFIYYEETDWCVRATEQGWQCVCVPGAHMWHRISAAMGPASPATSYYMSRNRLLFIGKHTCGVRRMRVLARALAQEVRTIIAHSLKPRHRHRAAGRTARALALRDALLGRYGQMGADVAAVCFPNPAP